MSYGQATRYVDRYVRPPVPAWAESYRIVAGDDGFYVESDTDPTKTTDVYGTRDEALVAFDNEDWVQGVWS